jgi:hypothetical protein
MTTVIIFLSVLFALLIGFAIWKRNSVRASFNFRSVGFSLEASDRESRNESIPSLKP